ncbi:hypothetical protein K438DRAFT_1774706 [Mycena galopus ATCC 62051]|nr:hypothetical protein K438DRAFT_1774706 [Mycena galopus ATCC 62051]
MTDIPFNDPMPGGFNAWQSQTMSQSGKPEDVPMSNASDVAIPNEVGFVNNNVAIPNEVGFVNNNVANPNEVGFVNNNVAIPNEVGLVIHNPNDVIPNPTNVGFLHTRDVSMHGLGEDPLRDLNVPVGHNTNLQSSHGSNLWASDQPERQPERPNMAKRIAVGNPARQDIEDARLAADIAREKAKSVLREKRELEQQRRDLESQLATAQQEIQGLRGEQHKQYNCMKARDEEWETELRRWEDHLEMFKGNVNQDFQRELEQSQAANIARMKEHLAGEIAAREAAYNKQLEEIQENVRRQEDEQQCEHEKKRLELEKKQVDYETKLTALHARFSAQRVGTRLPENSGTENVHFPQVPPARIPEFVSAATREQCRLDVVIRQGPGRFPMVSETAPTQPAPSMDPPTDPATTPDDTSGRLLMDLDDPRVIARLQGLFGEAIAKGGGGKGVRKTRQRKGGATAALVKARREQQQQLSHTNDLRWKAIVREYWRLKTGCDRAKDFNDYVGVTKETAQRCEEGETAPKAQSKFFFGNGWGSALWNITILDRWVKEVLQKRSEDPGHYDVPDVSEAYKLVLRRETTNKMLKISLAKEDQDGARVWKWLGEDFLGELDIGGMSSEEDEPAEVHAGNQRMLTTVHNIKTHRWRAQKANEYVQMIDDSTETCMTKHVHKRIRVRTGEKSSRSDPPLKLPRALYDPAWLSQQKQFIPEIEKHLEISDKVFTMMEIEVAQSSGPSQ